MKAALEQLGFGPCYHMSEFFKHPEHAATWRAAAQGQPVDWRTFFHDYQSAVDEPSSAFYKAQMQSFPDAKVILTVRDPERWYDSCLETIYPLSQTFPISLVGRFLPHVGPFFSVIDKLVWKGVFNRRFLDRAFTIAMFNRRNEEVKRYVPPERLLIFEVKQGWEPLCRFLGVPVPQGVPFPHLNDTAEFRERIVQARIIALALLTLGVGGVLTILRALVRRR